MSTSDQTRDHDEIDQQLLSKLDELPPPPSDDVPKIDPYFSVDRYHEDAGLDSGIPPEVADRVRAAILEAEYEQTRRDAALIKKEVKEATARVIADAQRRLLSEIEPQRLPQ